MRLSAVADSRSRLSDKEEVPGSSPGSPIEESPAQPSGKPRSGRAMHRSATIVLLAAFAVATGCGGGDGDESSIERSLRAYFVFDKSPDFDAYCRSFISVHDQDTFRHGSPSALARDARATETRCRNRSEILRPNHTGWPDAQIGKIERHGDRARASVNYRLRGHGIISRGAQLARIHEGDWRILLAGYD
jgi:hypothetical protein